MKLTTIKAFIVSPEVFEDLNKLLKCNRFRFYASFSPEEGLF